MEREIVETISYRGFDIETERMAIKGKSFAKYILCN